MTITIKSNPDGVSGAIQVNGNDAVVIGTQGITQGAPFSFRNKIINGKMEIAQRGTSFAGASGYTLDRWTFNNGSSAVATVSQQTDVPSNNEFYNSMRATITTADTSIAAGDVVHIAQKIEGSNVRNLIGNTLTLSFWVRSAKTGVHCVSLTNSAADRSFVSEYTVNVANTWEKKTILVSGGLITAGTWNWTNGSGVELRFALAAGSTFQTTAGAWQTGNLLATANQVNVLDTVGNIFAITGVQLEAGSIATPFEHRPYGTELALCQRYYEVFSQYLGVTASSTAIRTQNTFKVEKRANPTVSLAAALYTDYPGSAAYAQSSANIVLNSVSTNAAITECGNFTGMTQGRPQLCYTNMLFSSEL